jgi:hypothetical protein
MGAKGHLVLIITQLKKLLKKTKVSPEFIIVCFTCFYQQGCCYYLYSIRRIFLKLSGLNFIGMYED